MLLEALRWIRIARFLRPRRRAGRALVLATLLGAIVAAASADNTDQTSAGSRYAWGENIGWLKARPASEAYGPGGSGLQVTDTDVTGSLWGENIGWVNFSCKNNATCGGPAVNWGVKNDGSGHLSGYAWAENVGWLNFSCTNDSTCGGAAGTWGVSVATPGPYEFLKDWGMFHGYAWGENIGWISFTCQNNSSCGAVPYGVQTGWPNSSGDGYTDAKHVLLGKNPFTYCKIMRADINGDGTVNALDLSILAKKFLTTVPPTLARVEQNNPPDTSIDALDLSIESKLFLQPVTACP